MLSKICQDKVFIWPFNSATWSWIPGQIFFYLGKHTIKLIIFSIGNRNTNSEENFSLFRKWLHFDLWLQDLTNEEIKLCLQSNQSLFDKN